MGFLEDQVQNLTRRIKRIEQNPNPSMLQSNKLRYEIELDEFTSILEAWREGKNFANIRSGAILAQPLGFAANLGGSNWGDRALDPQKYLDLAITKFGFPEHTCDRTMVRLGLGISGELPLVRLATAARIICEPERLAAQAEAQFTGTLFFDVPRLTTYDYMNVQILGEELGELIEFAEKSIPGIKYDEAKLIELQEMDHDFVQTQRDVYELLKRVPCPLTPQDTFRMTRPPSRSMKPEKAQEYAKIYRDELFERAEKGMSGVTEERLRIAWLATGPFGRGTFDLLAKKGIGMPLFYRDEIAFEYGAVLNDYGDDSVYGHKLTPLQEIGRRQNCMHWGGDAELWIRPLIKLCRELKIDAVVDFLQAGCIPTKNLKKITAQRLKDELGIPTLDLEGRQMLMTETATAEMEKRLEEFLDMCLASKK